MRKVALFFMLAAAVGLALGWNVDGFINPRLGIDLLWLFIVLAVLCFIIGSVFKVRICAVCDARIGKATPKYSIKGSDVICPACFEKTGRTTYDMETIKEFSGLAVDDIKALFEAAKTPPQVNNAKPEMPPASAPFENVKVPDDIKGYPLAYHYKDVKIAVLRGQEPDYSLINPGDIVTLIQEPHNPHDNKAVALMANGIKVGYLFRGKLQDMANDFINGGYPVFSAITGIDDSARLVEIFLGFYREKDFAYKHILNSGKLCMEYKLTANASEAMQSDISSCKAGDRVTLSYDYNKEKYLVLGAFGISGIGYLPTSAHKHVNANNYDAMPVFVDDVYLDDNGKYIVTVVLQAEN